MQFIISICSLLLLAISVQSKTYVSVKSYKSSSCTGSLVNSTYYESGVCYTMRQLCEEDKMPYGDCKNILTSPLADQYSFKVTCSGKTVKPGVFPDPKCSSNGTAPENAIGNADMCVNIGPNLAQIYSCTEIRPAIILNGAVITPAETTAEISVKNAGESRNIIFGIISIMSLAFLV